MSEFSIVLQAGGKSSRMGADKALIPFMETTLLGYIIDQVNSLSDDIIIISNHPERFEPFGLPVFADIFPDWGALGGLHSAIHHAHHDLCIVLACDMPFLAPGFLEYILLQSEDYDAVIPRLDKTGFTEPFRAVYRKTCLQPIEDAIKKQQRRVNSFFDQVNVRYVDQSEIEVFDPALQTFFNVNTPADLEKAVILASRDQ